MTTRITAIQATGVFLSLLLGSSAEASADATSRQPRVASILQQCVTCHSGAAPQAGLDLTSRESALRGGRSGAAFTPGRADSSLIYTMTAARLMPPGEPLTQSQVEHLAAWINDGAAWDFPANETLEGAGEGNASKRERAGLDWWVLQPVRRPSLPSVQAENWVRNDIDRFVLARLESADLSPSPRSNRARLIRRAHLDLLGLPPSPEDIEQFIGNPDPKAYEKLVDRLLESPDYGERWGRHWLDIVRFGESQGYERDKIRDHAWRYRDYVINSFNSDKPYTQFAKEQLAGDVLRPATREGVIATGFLVVAPWDEVGHQQQSKIMRQRVRADELEDVVGVVSQTFLGMTVNCARCHDHKFDPIPQKDYYRVQAAFQGAWHGDRSILTPDEQAVRQQKIVAIERRIRDIEEKLVALEAPARRRVLAERGGPSKAGLPKPVSRWTFDLHAKDSTGMLHGRLRDGVEISGGRARFPNEDSQIRTGPLHADLGERTYEAWVAMTDLGTNTKVMALTSPARLGANDSLIYYADKKGWRNKSEYEVRTQLTPMPDETAKPGELIQIALVYSDDDAIRMYRNGLPYGEPYYPEVKGAAGKLQTFSEGDAFIAFGPGAVEIDEVRLYGRALSAAEIAVSYRAGISSVSLEDLLHAMAPAERSRRDSLVAALATLEAELGAIPPEPLSYAANSRQPGPSHVLLRGDPAHPLDPVKMGVLSAVRTLAYTEDEEDDVPEGLRRLRFAEWVTDPRNPLTARVMVNRVWHYHFGRGIVDTPNDFGFNGGRPSHPELLDWLADRFMAEGWSVKRLHKLIMTSATYRQSSDSRKGAAERDPDNHLLWRFAPRRLEAEAIRDAMLAVSRELNPERGGTGFRPFDLRIFNSHFYDLKDVDEPEYNRRTVYRIVVQSARDPLLEAFDCPDPSAKTPKRASTTTPIQSLGLMNSSFVLRQASRLAERVRSEDRGSLGDRVERAYYLALGRAPSSHELERAVRHSSEHGLESFCWALLNSSEFLYLN